MFALLWFAIQTSAVPERFSVLADPCASMATGDDEIVVCAPVAAAPRLPLPDERAPPDRPMASNPELTGRGAMAAAASPCATLSQGCGSSIDVIGGGVFLVRAVGKLIDPDSCCEDAGEYKDAGRLLRDVGGLFKRRAGKVEKARRVAIPLDPATPIPNQIPPTVDRP